MTTHILVSSDYRSIDSLLERTTLLKGVSGPHHYSDSRRHFRISTINQSMLPLKHRITKMDGVGVSGRERQRRSRRVYMIASLEEMKFYTEGISYVIGDGFAATGEDDPTLLVKINCSPAKLK